MKVAVVGTGIAGMVAAWMLHSEHELTVYEAGAYPGGHTNTLDVTAGGADYAIDTGFIVFNERNYPNFVRILRQLGVAWQPSEMSFSVRDEETGLEYNGSSLNGLFAQRRNLLRPSFLRMARDILRFYREAGELLVGMDPGPTLGEYLRAKGYSRAFVEQHLLPMAAAVWSASESAVGQLPARFLVRFFHQHGFLQLRDRPQWQVIAGGSREYARRLVAPFRSRIRLETPVTAVRREAGGVAVATARGTETFDEVVLAVHGDQALALLAAPTAAEREVLGAFRFQKNQVLLHTDTSLLPRRPRAWAGWNYHRTGQNAGGPTVTYLMNALQGIPGPPWFLVSLNREDAVDPARVLARLEYDHPVYDPAAVAAQQRHGEISGADRIHYCGAWWGYGFHEDGVNSALAVARRFGRELAG